MTPTLLHDPTPTLRSGTGRFRALTEGADGIAVLVWAAFLLVSFVILLRVGTTFWFLSDDWGFFVDRHGVGDLFRPQNQHWSTTPILIYLLLYRLVGLNTYLPYVGVLIVMYLVLATLVRLTMRRAGVAGWVATVVAAPLVLFGPGDQNIFQAVQISQVGTLMFGFAHLILADHDEFDRRDLIGIGLGALGLMSSGIGPAFVVIVAGAVLLRRGWRAAFLHSFPLAVIYVGWFLSAGSGSGLAGKTQIKDLVEWPVYGESGVFLALYRYPPVAVAVAAVLVVGLVLAWRKPWAEVRVRASMPLACLVGAPVLFALISTSRAIMGLEQARASRYAGMAAALTLPAIGVAVDAIVRRRAVLAVPLSILVLAGAPANALDLGATAPRQSSFDLHLEHAVAVGRAPAARLVPPDHHFDPSFFGLDQVPTGFLVEAEEGGYLPDVTVSPAMAQRVAVELSIAQRLDRPASASCTDVGKQFRARLPAGTTIGLRADTSVRLVGPDASGAEAVSYRADRGAALVVLLEGEFQFTSTSALSRC